MRLDRLGEIVVTDALLVLYWFVWAVYLDEFGQHFSVTQMMKIERVTDELHTRVATKLSTPTSFGDVYRVYNLYTVHNATATRCELIGDSQTFKGKPNCQR